MLTAQQVKDKARDLGFDLCGIAPVDSFPELDFLKEWLDKGYAGDMAWMARSASRRADVRQVVSDARCVIVTGTVSSGASLQGQAKISRYAWGDDYHDVLKKRLDALLAWMHEANEERRQGVPADAAPFAAASYVDTGPVPERVYA